MSNLWDEVRRSWIKEDYLYLNYLKRQLVDFNRLYLKHFDKPLYREINSLVINDLKDEMGAVNARLHRNKTNKRSIRYRLAGDTAETGQAGN